MKRTALLILMFSWTFVYSEKEVEEEYAKILSSKLWQEIRKRLDSGDSPSVPNQELISCPFSVNSSTIIRTRDSIDLGAEFLSSPKINSEKECSKLCCDTPGCNVAVFKNKTEERSCYLFNCGTPIQKKCLFSHHPGFSVLIAQNSIQKSGSTKQEQQQHEDDLDNVAVATTTTTTTTTTLPTTTTPKPTPKPTTTVKTTTTAKEKATLYAECTTKDDCLPAHSECVVGICICKDGYHAQNGLCQPGSDTGKHKSAPPEQDVSGSKHVSGQKSSPPEKPKPTTPVPVKPTSTGKPKTNKQSDETMAALESLLKEVLGTHTEKPSTKSTTTSAPTTHVPATTTSTPAPSTKKAEKPDNKSSVVVASNQQQDLEDAEDQFDENSMNSPQGAVIALGLGLAVTCMLLVFVGCRLRMMKRRLRRGRPVNSNEADYLINGMYL